MPPAGIIEGQGNQVKGDLNRLLAPRSIVVVGGGAWCRQVVLQCQAMGFQGDIYRVHPDPAPVGGIAAVAALSDLPVVPDAAFLGINRRATIAAVRALSESGAGGAVCFASGFSEASAEDAGGVDLQNALVAAAGDMPILGPNCYGFINALDGALLWPDQHGCQPVARGVAILTQSSNIAINLTMQRRGLPVAFTVTCGNMAQTTQAQIALSLLQDDRVTAIGLHIEGFDDTASWHAVAQAAQNRGVPIIALKVGSSEQARAATVSHTASLAGSDAGARALMQRLGFAQVFDLSSFLSALMIGHCTGGVATKRIASISCSGGEASLVADSATRLGLEFPPLKQAQRAALAAALGPMVALSNPLDYHTYVWGDAEKMAAAWLPMADPQVGILLIVLDYPHTDASDWQAATKAAIAVRQRSDRPLAVVATLPELMPTAVAKELLAAGVIPLNGLQDALVAIAALAERAPPAKVPSLPARAAVASNAISEADGKALLGRFGVCVPKGTVVPAGEDLRGRAQSLTAPLALKSDGLAHKSDAGGVRLHLDHGELDRAAAAMPGDQFLVEEMVTGGVAELLVGVVRDDAHGFVLTLAPGGVLTELWNDRVSLLLPVTRADVETALDSLRTGVLLRGYRGAQAADIAAIWQAVDAVQRCVMAQADEICEIEINPLICTPTGAWAADALVVVALLENDTRSPNK